MKSVLAQGKTLLSNRIPVSKISAKVQLRNRTTSLWNRKLSNGAVIFKQQRYQYLSKNANDVTNEKKTLNYNAMRLFIITGITIFIGSMIVKYNQNIGQKIDEDENGTFKSKRIKITNNNWMVFCYSTLPLNAVSRLWGQFNSLTLPIWLRPVGYKFYSNMFGVNLDEMVDPELEHYANLSEFFYRDIKPESRPIIAGSNVIVCPSDGKVLQLGIIDSETGEIEQVKGMTYSIKEFLGTHSHPLMSKSDSDLDLNIDEKNHVEFAKQNDIVLHDSSNNTEAVSNIKFKVEGDTTLEASNPTASKTVKLLSELSMNYPSYGIRSKEPIDTDLYFAVIYLAPGDYHHFHSPIDWVCKVRRHFPGALFSVAPYFQRNFPNLFVLNERVALLGHWKYGFFSMTPVGATNVGSIKLNYDKKLVTNIKHNGQIKPKTCYEATYKNASEILGGIPLVKGEDMGGFELGSTVVLCFEAPSSFKYKIKVGDTVKMGQELGSVY